MIARQETYRGMESDMRDMRTPWDNEPVPDHTTLVRHLQTIPKDWLDRILAETARRCIIAAGRATGPLGADSSGVETSPAHQAATATYRRGRSASGREMESVGRKKSGTWPIILSRSR